jgi:molybdate transport system permease protein
VEAVDWGCAVRVEQKFVKQPKHVAIRAHHVRLHPARKSSEKNRENEFPCWLAAMTETPFRVTLDLRIGTSPAGPVDFHLQAEVFKQEWELFRNLPQPWAVELAADRVFLLED